MIDHHIHFGQFEEVYYEPLEIMRIVTENGINGCVYTSTSSCIDGVKYSVIEAEITQVAVRYPVDTFMPYLWYIPPYIDQGITVEKAMLGLSYKGIKLHPFAHTWSQDNKKTKNALHAIFCYAMDNHIPVLIHTGPNGVDAPNALERFFIEYPKAQCILAHCRPLDEAVKMMQKYENVYGDTSFVPRDWMKQIVQAGLGQKIFTGSDFPITHFSETHFSQNNMSYTLEEQYLRDIEEMKFWEEYLWETGNEPRSFI